jgi:small-conductance mechanosensitive channel
MAYQPKAAASPLFVALVLFAALFGADAFAQSDSGPHVFKVESLNPGLPEPERLIDRSTPQTSLETFMMAGETEDWARAAQILDLSALPEDRQNVEGPILAQQLHYFLERSLNLDWAGISDRPDAVDVTATDQSAFAGEPRRSLRLALISAEGRSISVRIARLKTEDGDPMWMFPRQTVEEIPVLYGRYGPSPFEETLPSFLRAEAFWTLAWWEVIALPLVIIFAGLLAAAVWRALSALKRSDHLNAFDGIVRAVRLPMTLLVFAAVFTLVQALLFTFSGAVNSVLEPIMIALIVIALGALIVEFIDAAIDRVANSKDEDVTHPNAEADRAFYTTLSAVRRFVLVIFLIVGTAFVLIESNLTRTMGFSLLASAGVIGLVLAFAARELLANIMASLQIAFAKTARIGDAVLFEDRWCYVEKIGFTHVRLRTWDDKRMMTPVTEFVSSTFENWTKTDPTLAKYVVLTLDHRADVDQLRGPFEEFIDAEEGVLNREEAKVTIIGHSRDGMEARFLFYAGDPSTAWEIHCRLREMLLKKASELDVLASQVEGPTFLPREREVRLGSAG